MYISQYVLYKVLIKASTTIMTFDSQEGTKIFNFLISKMNNLYGFLRSLITITKSELNILNDLISIL